MMQQHHPLLGRSIEVSSGDARLKIRPGGDAARFSLRLDPAQLGAASHAFGFELPRKIGAVSAGGEKLAVCLGPDEWRLVAPLSDQRAVESRFAALYPTVLHSLVDIGHRDVSIEIEGSKAALALQSAIAFDVETMPVATGCRTIFDKAQVIMLRKAEDQFQIDVWPSYCEHVWGLLQAVSREIQLGI
jgi:sarcosine oxidase subunit gamma